jgi:AraC-like DNA-binding protein
MLNTPLQYSTEGRGPADGAAEYGALLNERLVRGLRIEPSTQFQGKIFQRAQGPWRVTDITYTGYAGKMGPSEDGGAPLYILYHQTGDLIARNDRAQRVRLQPGDIVICRHYGDVTLETNGDACRQTSIMFDPEYAAAIAPQLLNDFRRLKEGSGAGRLIAAHLRALAEHADEMSATVMGQVAETCLQLASAEFPNVRGTTAVFPSTAQLSQIQDYMLKHLPDPDMTPDSVAKTFAISRRTLDRLFEDAEAAAANWLKRRRLEAAYAALANPVQRDKRISQIAYECGFLHPAHFCRAFSATFKMSPSDFRRRRLRRYARN